MTLKNKKALLVLPLLTVMLIGILTVPHDAYAELKLFVGNGNELTGDGPRGLIEDYLNSECDVGSLQGTGYCNGTSANPFVVVDPKHQKKGEDKLTIKFSEQTPGELSTSPTIAIVSEIGEYEDVFNFGTKIRGDLVVSEFPLPATTIVDGKEVHLFNFELISPSTKKSVFQTQFGAPQTTP